jgi:hypothetical protein
VEIDGYYTPGSELLIKVGGIEARCKVQSMNVVLGRVYCTAKVLAIVTDTPTPREPSWEEVENELRSRGVDPDKAMRRAVEVMESHRVATDTPGGSDG